MFHFGTGFYPLSGNRRTPAMHVDADVIEFALLERGDLAAPPVLFLFLHQLVFLELGEGFVKFFAQTGKLRFQLFNGALQVVPWVQRGFCEGWIRIVTDVADAAALLLGLNLLVQIRFHPAEIGDHRLDIGDLTAFFVNLEPMQAYKCFP